MMPHIPTFSGRNPDVSNYGAYHGFVRTVTRLGPDASASVSLYMLRDSTLGVVRPEMIITGSASATPPDPGTYAPMSPAQGLFFCVPYTQVGSGPFPPPTYTSVLRARLRGAGSSNPNINYYAYPNSVWTDPASNDLYWASDTTNHVGNASVLLDLAFDGNTNNYQTYLIRNSYTA